MIKEWLRDYPLYDKVPQGATPLRYMVIAEDSLMRAAGENTQGYNYVLEFYCRSESDSAADYARSILMVLDACAARDAQVSSVEVESMTEIETQGAQTSGVAVALTISGALQ
jgi:hypothetical protein